MLFFFVVNFLLIFSEFDFESYMKVFHEKVVPLFFCMS